MPPKSELERCEVAPSARSIGLTGLSGAVAGGISLFLSKADPSIDIKDAGKPEE